MTNEKLEQAKRVKDEILRIEKQLDRIDRAIREPSRFAMLSPEEGIHLEKDEKIQFFESIRIVRIDELNRLLEEFEAL